MSPPHEEATAALPPANSVVAGDLGLSAFLTFAGEREPINPPQFPAKAAAPRMAF